MRLEIGPNRLLKFYISALKGNQSIWPRMVGSTACSGVHSRNLVGSVFMMVATNIGATGFMNIVENPEIAIEAS